MRARPNMAARNAWREFWFPTRITTVRCSVDPHAYVKQGSALTALRRDDLPALRSGILSRISSRVCLGGTPGGLIQMTDPQLSLISTSGLSAFVAFLVVWLTSRLASIRAHDDRVWDRKAGAYAAIFEALYDMEVFFDQ